MRNAAGAPVANEFKAKSIEVGSQGDRTIITQTVAEPSHSFDCCILNITRKIVKMKT